MTRFYENRRKISFPILSAASLQTVLGHLFCEGRIVGKHLHMLPWYCETCLWFGRLARSGARCIHLPGLWLSEAEAVAESAQLPRNSTWDSGTWRDSSPLPVCCCGRGCDEWVRLILENSSHLRIPYLLGDHLSVCLTLSFKLSLNILSSLWVLGQMLAERGNHLSWGILGGGGERAIWDRLPCFWGGQWWNPEKWTCR